MPLSNWFPTGKDRDGARQSILRSHSYPRLIKEITLTLMKWEKEDCEFWHSRVYLLLPRKCLCRGRNKILKRTGYVVILVRRTKGSLQSSWVPIKMRKLERVYGPEATLWSRIRDVSEETWFGNGKCPLPQCLGTESRYWNHGIALGMEEKLSDWMEKDL